jgi:L-ascorbate metabolism protein UlaG (beta-lactamase superfamily)
MTNYRLKQTITAEPLFNRWYAWPLLIYPPTAALITRNLHLRLLESYRNMPQLHNAAATSRSLAGGKFVQANVSIDEVAALHESTVLDLQSLLEMAQAIDTLTHLLAKTATGLSLEPLYAQVPAPLRGYVELVYDLENRPGMRFLERLLYQGECYREDRQSILLSDIDETRRPFVLSTPRFPLANEIELTVPFRSEVLDRLFSARTTLISESALNDLGCELNVPTAKRDAFRAFFAPVNGAQPPRRPEPEQDVPGLRIRYFGHATLLLQHAGTTILTDPLVSYGTDGALVTDRYTIQDLPERIDCVAVTHAHQDHTVIETLLQIRQRSGNVLVPKSLNGALQDPSLKILLERIGMQHVQEIAEFEEVHLPGCRVTGIPFLGEHGDLNIASKMAYLVEADGVKVLCLADANNIEPAVYRRVREHIGRVDALFVGMECAGAPVSWLYGPLYSQPISNRMDRARRLNASDSERAMEFVRIFEPRAVFVYAMGADPWMKHLSSIEYTDDSMPIIESNKLIEACRARGILAERLAGRREIWLTRETVEVR